MSAAISFCAPITLNKVCASSRLSHTARCHATSLHGQPCTRNQQRWSAKWHPKWGPLRNRWRYRIGIRIRFVGVLKGIAGPTCFLSFASNIRVFCNYMNMSTAPAQTPMRAATERRRSCVISHSEVDLSQMIDKFDASPLGKLVLLRQMVDAADQVHCADNKRYVCQPID